MKAVYFQSHGGPEVLTYGDRPDPVAGAGMVVVDIHAASVNGADWKVRSGASRALEEFPHIPGRDFSGVVSATGPQATDFEVGDPVFGVCEVSQEGAYAEKTAINQAILARKPDAWSHEQAASVALTGLTAIVSIEESLKLKSGETILVQGGAGGVAGFAIQLAKHIGATVVTTASARNIDYVRSLGADLVIDYNADDFTKSAGQCDAVLDTVGGDVATRSFDVLKPGGRAAFIASGPEAPPTPDSKIRSLRPHVDRGRKYLQRIVELVEAGAVRFPEIVTYPLSDAATASAVSEGRHVRGKLVLKVR